MPATLGHNPKSFKLSKKVPRKSVSQSESSSDNSAIVYSGNETLFRGNILIQELTLQKVSKTKAVSFSD